MTFSTWINSLIKSTKLTHSHLHQDNLEGDVLWQIPEQLGQEHYLANKHEAAASGGYQWPEG